MKKFSVRELFLVVTIVAFALGWSIDHFQQKLLRRRAWESGEIFRMHSLANFNRLLAEKQILEFALHERNQKLNER